MGTPEAVPAGDLVIPPAPVVLQGADVLPASGAPLHGANKLNGMALE